VKKIKVTIKVKLAHSTSICMIVATYTSLVTYETTWVCKSRWVAHMCYWFTSKPNVPY
jgi:hypothetical protein